MRLGPAGLKLIKQFENCRLQRYRDTGGVWTIGWGHAIPSGKPETCTQAEADEWLIRDCREAEAIVNDLVSVNLSQAQFDALCCFAYNVGRGHFAESTLRRKLNKSDYLSVPGELAKWVNDNGVRIEGLVNRRNAEIALWQGEQK